MTDDLFDIGDSADDADDTADTSDTSTTDDANNDTNAVSAVGGDPATDPAFDAEYRDHQHTIAMLDDTWGEFKDLRDDARARCQLDGYEDVSKFEVTEAMARLLIEDAGSDVVAEKIQQMREDEHRE